MSSIKYWRDLIKSGGICGLLLLVRPVIYLLFSRQRNLNAYAAVDVSAIIFIIYAVICFFAAYKVLSKSGSSFGRALIKRTPLIWFVIYTIYGLFSMFWSVNLVLSAFRAFECASMILLIVAIMQKLFSTCNIDRIIDWTILYVSVDIILSIIGVAQWSTNISSLLGASQMMSTTFFYMALFYPRKKWYHYLIIIMAIFSGSTVSYIGMAIGTISLFWLKTKYKPLFLIGIICIGMSFAIIGPQKIIKETLFYDKESISIEETSGRDHLMEVAIETVKEYPWGLGFFAGEPLVFYSKSLSAINAHNSIFSAGIGLGYAGIIIMSIFLLKVFFTVFSKKIAFKYRAALIGCFFVGFLQCMGNPALGSRVFGAWLPVTYLFTLICSFYLAGKYKNLISNK